MQEKNDPLEEIFQFKCRLCNTAMILPKCCSKTVNIEGEKLVCISCRKEVPIKKCCGVEMLIMQV